MGSECLTNRLIVARHDAVGRWKKQATNELVD